MCKYNNTTGAEENQVCVKIDIFPLFVFAFIVNIIALIAVLKARSKESWCNAAKPIHVLILCLSTSDTLTVGFQCFMPISSFINCGWAGGQASCGFFGFITAVLMVWSAWIVVFLSFQRFLVTSYPFRYRYHFTTKKIIRALVATFVAECAYFAPPFFGIGQFVYYDTGQFCSLSLTPTGETDTVYLGTLVAQGFVCVLLTVIFNLSVVLRLRARWMTFPGFKSRGNEHSTATFVSLTKAVALLFCLCYIPLLIRMAIDLWKQTSYEDLGVEHTITMALLFVNTLANPFIYVACRKRYRQSLKNLCFGCCGDSTILGRKSVAPEKSVFVIHYTTRGLNQQTNIEQITTAF